jgi:hypothetical protein
MTSLSRPMIAGETAVALLAVIGRDIVATLLRTYLGLLGCAHQS